MVLLIIHAQIAPLASSNSFEFLKASQNHSLQFLIVLRAKPSKFQFEMANKLSPSHFQVSILALTFDPQVLCIWSPFERQHVKDHHFHVQVFRQFLSNSFLNALLTLSLQYFQHAKGYSPWSLSHSLFTKEWGELSLWKANIQSQQMIS